MELEKREIVWKHHARRAEHNTKKYKITSIVEQREFSVFISSYVNTALNQSAFRILKCYIISSYIVYAIMVYLANINH